MLEDSMEKLSYEFDVCSSYVFMFLLFFSRTTVSAVPVLQPCRTCHMLCFLLARCIVRVLGK